MLLSLLSCHHELSIAQTAVFGRPFLSSERSGLAVISSEALFRAGSGGLSRIDSHLSRSGFIVGCPKEYQHWHLL
jgi:hypothetical protein